MCLLGDATELRNSPRKASAKDRHGVSRFFHLSQNQHWFENTSDCKYLNIVLCNNYVNERLFILFFKHWYNPELCTSFKITPFQLLGMICIILVTARLTRIEIGTGLFIMDGQQLSFISIASTFETASLLLLIATIHKESAENMRKTIFVSIFFFILKVFLSIVAE